MSENLSRSAILGWIRSLGLSISRIEELGKGVILCQLLNLLDNAGLRFRENVRTESGYLSNLLLVKNYLENKSIKLFFPADRMCKLKMQDNLEVGQLFYKRWAHEGALAPEEPAPAQAVESNGAAAAQPAKCTAEAQPKARPSDCGIVQLSNDSKAFEHSLERKLSLHDSDREQLEAKVEASAKRIEELHKIAGVFENERDFYFEKLMAVEQLVLGAPTLDASIKDAMLDILYKVEYEDK
ncbi:microtubule-associated protein, RP/EB family [Pancytospora philotis]|nr:microtubule-associated protein, RP/EB family [Pancytospora philotis]